METRVPNETLRPCKEDDQQLQGLNTLVFYGPHLAYVITLYIMHFVCRHA
uniref:Uncharacterized protein n=1 Tax=Nelumbo nucifera TaxID=4432 RepID=A0A822XQV1_NELNU|nr:TPA_asm: hypothetical protein HUJ06_022588 [Nelumbo nucifera]